ncbi:MAG: glycosyltransferase family protein [Desulfonatronovibrionaceae bacterium]
MNILAVNLALAEQLKSLGYNVLELKPRGGICRLGNQPGVREFQPDLIIQQETLGPRVLLDGLENFACPAVYWSIDTHLNFFWQRFYIRNFDLVLTSQKSWVKRFHHLCSTSSAWLPWFGRNRSWTPWNKRDVEVSFVGRITEHRAVRARMADFLQKEYAADIRENMSFVRMLDHYSRTRFVPNESIAGEINFRMFEAACCGALVLNQKLMEDIQDLYEPGREIVVFEHVLELKDWLDYLRKKPEAARQMAFRAWNRTRQKHLPGHRARSMMAAAEDHFAAPKKDPDKNLWLAVFELWDSGRMNLSLERIRQKLYSLPLDEEILTAIVRAEHRGGGRLLDLLIPVLQRRQYDHDCLVNLTCSAAALAKDRGDLAAQFCKRQALQHCARTGPLDKPLQVYLFWAKELTRKGWKFRPGFMFHPGQHLPQSGLECLLMASMLEPEDKDILIRIKRIVQGQSGLESMVLKIISYASLKERHNWRWNLELGFFHLKSFGLHQGLEEFYLGLENAEKAGELDLFLDMVAKRDKKGYISGILSRSR